MKMAVIIPTLHEAKTIGTLIGSLAQGSPALRIVVADCGSTDGTVQIVKKQGVEVVTGPELTSRGRAMSAGAAYVLQAMPQVQVLWFLHADSGLTPGWHDAIAATLADPRVVGGAFRQRFDLAAVGWCHRMLLHMVNLGNRVRYHLAGRYLGDQGLFVRTESYKAVGGMPPLDLLEDVAFCQRLKRVGLMRLAPGVLHTSPRRFLRHGVLRQAFYDVLILSANRLGVRRSNVFAWYNREKI